MIRAAAAALVILAGSAMAAPALSPVTATDAVIRPAPRGLPTTAAYLTLKNRSDRPLRVVKIECGCADAVSVHESAMTGGVMHMAETALTVAPKAQVTLKPGGLHVMVMGLKRAIAPGDTVPMRLSFDRGAPIIVRFKAGR